jgi:DHA1 family multidrug resistance protein-like MFS transporter
VSGRAGSDEPERTARTPIPADIWVLVSAAFIVALGYGLIAPILPQFAASFDLGVTAASVVVSSFAFFRLVFAPAGGRLVDRLGERRVYVTGLLIVAASTGAVAAAQDYWQLLLFRGLGGIGSTMFTVSAMALIVRLAPPHARGRASGLYASSFVFGNILGPVAGGLLAGLGMRLPFIIYAAGLVVAALVVWVRLERQPQLDSQPVTGNRPGPEGTGAEAGSGEAAAAPAERERMRFRDAWQDSAYKAALGSGLAVGWAAMGARIAMYPLFVVAVLGAEPAVSGVALTVFSVGMAVSVSMAGRFTDTWGRRPFLIVGLGVLGAATMAVGLVDSIWVFFVLSLLAGLGGGLINPAQQAALGDIIGPDRKGGTVLSRFQMAQDLGAIAGPIVSGMLVDALGYGLAFTVTGAVALLAALGWLCARETLGTRPA